MTRTNVPKTMQGVQLDDYHEDLQEAIRRLRIVELPVPDPSRGQVLVEIAAAACNPSDLLLLTGKYGVRKTLPTVPGWEGAGRVVAHGGGLLSRWPAGKRVACVVQTDGGGTWAPYAVTQASSCIPLKRQLGWQQAAGLIINPLTAMGLLDTARRAGHRAAVQTAGAGQLGRMLIRMAADAHFPLISIVRRDEQLRLLQSLGAQHVLNSARDTFLDELKDTSRQLRATAAFEAIAGDMTGIVANAMPSGTCVYLYGGLSEEPCGKIDPIQIIFRKKTIRGFYLGSWLASRGLWGILRAANRAQRLLLEGRIETTIQRRVALPAIQDGLQQYVQHMTDGKLLITPRAEDDTNGI